MIDFINETFCIDESMIWAGGFSNGAMFNYELAHDPRTSKVLAGIVPSAGLPHYGFNFGPNETMSMFGFWGLYDDTCINKPTAADDGSYDPTRGSQPGGWFYTVADTVTETWAKALNCGDKESIDVTDYMIDSCWSYKNGDEGSEVGGCFHYAGHVGY